MTPTDIQNKRFDKGMGGYKTEEVHQYLAQVAEYVIELEQDRADLEKKLEVLAEKLEEYREDEDSLRAALIGAQKLGDSVVRESKRKAEAIIAGAVRKAEEIAQDAQRKIDAEAFELEKMRAEVASFKAQLMKLYSQHLKLIECLPDNHSEVEAPRINYTPPSAESVKINVSTEQENGDIHTEELVMSVTGMEVAPDTMDGSYPPDDTKPNKLRYDKLNLGQFFGEDNPVQRE